MALNRRDLLGTAAAIPFLASKFAHLRDDAERLPIVDTNVSLFQWPFRRLPLDNTHALAEKLTKLGIAQAWAASFEALLHRDIAGVNQRLVDECKKYSQLVPIGCVNPALPSWEEDVRRCFNMYRMPGVRLHPNYHGYALDDDRVASLLKIATESRRFIQISVAMEDTRTQHNLVRVKDVDLTPLPNLLKRVPGAIVQVLNYRPRQPLFEDLAQNEGLFFDTARVEGTDGIANLLHSIPDRVMLGSHAPFFVPEAALIRVAESELTEEHFRRLLWKTAQQIGMRRPA